MFDRQGLLLLRTQPGQTQVENFDNSIFGEQQVGRFDVSMNNAPFMGVVQSFRRLTHRFGRFGKLKRAFFQHQLFQILASNVLHDQKMDIAFVVYVIRLHNVGVVERSNRLRFAMKTRQISSVVHQVLRQHFNGHLSLHSGVFCQINTAHAACAQMRQQFVSAQQKALMFSLHQKIMLPGREQPPFDEKLAEMRHILRQSRRIEFGHHFSQAAGFHQLAFSQTSQIGNCNRIGHDRCDPGKGTPPKMQFPHLADAVNLRLRCKVAVKHP